MQRFTFVEAPDGVRTTFTASGSAPAELALTLLVSAGQLWEKTASAPSGLQFTVSSWPNFTLGTAPAPGASLFGFKQTDATKGMRVETPALSFSNATSSLYVLSAAPPANSHVIAVYNTRVLEEVASNPGPLQFTLSGAQLTTGFPTTSTDAFFVYIEEPEFGSVNFAPVTLTGAKNGVNTLYDTGLAASAIYTRIFLVGHAGRVLQQQPFGMALSFGQFTYDDETQRIVVADAPFAGESLFAYCTQFVVRPNVNIAQTLWLADPQKPRIVLATMTAVTSSGPVTTSTLRYGSEDYATEPTDTPANTPWLGLLSGVPAITRKIEGLAEPVESGPPLRTRASVSFGELELANHQRSLDAVFGAYGLSVDGQSITLDLVGRKPDLAYADRATILRGILRDGTLESDAVRFPVLDLLGRLQQRKTAHAVLTTTEFPNLPSGVAGTYKPIAYGEIRNMEPILVDPGVRKYLLAGHPIDGGLVVRDNGVDITANATLTNTSSAATFTLSVTPTGKVTCDFRGRLLQQSSAYSNQAPFILEDVLLREGGLSTSDFHTARWNAFKVYAPWGIGLLIREPTEIPTVIEQALSGLPVYYAITPDGRVDIAVLQLPVGASSLILADDTVIREPVRGRYGHPYYRFLVQYDRIWAVHSDGELAASVPLATKARYKTEYRQVESVDATIQARWPLAEEVSLSTLLLSSADAATVGALWLSLFGVRRRHITIVLDAAPLLVSLGATVEFSSPRYSLSGKWLVGGMTWRLNESGAGLRTIVTELHLWQ